MTIWTADFWRSTAERAVRTAAQAGVLVLVGDAYESAQLNALTVDWWRLLGFMLGGALLAVLFSVAGNAVSKNGPAFTDAEVTPDSLVPPVDPEPRTQP